MSFVIHVFENDAVRSVAEATRYVYGEPTPTPGLKQKFARFVEDVTTAFPDLSEADEDGDDPNNIWSEGLNGGNTEEAIFNIGLKTSSVNAEVFVGIAHAAARAGLHVLDPQNARLYRSDRMMLADNGVECALPAQEDRQPPKQKPARFEVGTNDGATLLGEAFCRRAARHGYSMTRLNPYQIQPMRSVGELQQSIWFMVSMRDDETTLSGTFQVAADRISQVWRTVLGDRVQKYVANGGLFDFRLTAAEVSLHPPPNAPYEAGYGEVWTREEFDAWGEKFHAWYERDASAVMDRLNNHRSLGELLFTDKRLEYAFSRHYLIHEQFSLLVLARALNLPTFDQWVEAMWDQFKRGGSYAYKQALDDPQAELLTMLIAFLRSSEFRFGPV